MADISVLQLSGELALAVLAGVALNLTPCVLPAIPVKIRTIMREAGHRRRERLTAALAFGAGTLVFFLALGIVTAALHWTWGALFQSRAVIAVLVGVLLVFAYTTYRDVGLKVPQFAYALRGRRYIEPFLSGLLGALLATPCTGPFLGGVLAFTITRPPVTIVAIFAAVGVGLALPYWVLLAWPGLLERLPKAGHWTVRVRQLLAFVLLAAAVFFAQSLVGNIWARGLWALWFALLVLWGAVVLWRTPGRWARWLGPGAVLLGAVFLYGGGFIMGAAVSNIAWQPLTQARWQAARKSGQPVLVEYTADWCINCKVLERTVYARQNVVRALRSAHMQVLQADLTRPVSWLQQLLVSQGGAGLPFAVVLNAHGQVVARFAGLFSAQALVQAIHQVSGEAS